MSITDTDFISQFKVDIRNKSIKVGLACSRYIKFLKFGLFHHLFQKPAVKLGTSIFIYQTTNKQDNTAQINSLTQKCKEKRSNAILQEVIAMNDNKDFINAALYPKLLVGNYVVFQHDNPEFNNENRLILGFSECTEDYIRHAHLCSLIPKDHSFLCAGNFFILKNTPANNFTFLCLPLSNSWRFVKYFFRDKPYYSMLDNMNKSIADDAFRKFFNCDSSTNNSAVDTNFKVFCAELIRAYEEKINEPPEPIYVIQSILAKPDMTFIDSFEEPKKKYTILGDISEKYKESVYPIDKFNNSFIGVYPETNDNITDSLAREYGLFCVNFEGKWYVWQPIDENKELIMVHKEGVTANDIVEILTPKSGGQGSSLKKRTTEKFFLSGKSKPNTVYIGTRGGKYVKVKGKYVSLSKFK